VGRILKPGVIIQNQNLALADPGFFSLFDFPFRSGRSDRAIDAPNQVVLTEESASRFFGRIDPVGRVLSINMGNQPHDFIVTGVLKRIPGNSSIHFDLLISFKHFSDIFGEEFTGGLIDTPFFHAMFLELHPESSPHDLKTKLPGFVEKYYGEGLVSRFSLEFSFHCCAFGPTASDRTDLWRLSSRHSLKSENHRYFLGKTPNGREKYSYTRSTDFSIHTHLIPGCRITGYDQAD